MKGENEVLVTIMGAVILVSTLFASLPLVRAVYTVDHASFPPDLPGDVNNDGKVNLLDYFKVALAYGSSFGSPGWNALCDVNDDGKVNLIDVFRVQRLYGIPPYDTSANPIAYSTSFEFDVPNTGVPGVWYYILARIYVPSGLSSNVCFLCGSSDAGIKNVINDTVLVRADQPSGPFNITLGNLKQGYHLLELECPGPVGGGSTGFSVFTSAGEAVWLDRFRICVPNYSSSMIEYNVTTNTHFPTDTYYLGGYADKYVNDIWVDGTEQLWSDWEWDMGSYCTIYGADGFMYPIGERENGHTIQFKFGNNATGLLDFQYISWSNQRGKFGPPKFYSTVNFTPNNVANVPSRDGYLTHVLRSDDTTTDIKQAEFYGGSLWIDPQHPELSDRNFEASLRINASWFGINTARSGNVSVDMSAEVGLGLTYAKWVLTPGGTNDLGVMINLTSLHFYSNLPSENDTTDWWFNYYLWCLTLRNVTVDAFSCPWVEIPNEEHYPTGNSIVKTDYTAAANYVGTIITFVASALLTEGTITPVESILGTSLGVGIQGIAAANQYTSGQELQPYQETISELHHRQLQYSDNTDGYNNTYGPLKMFKPDQNQTSSVNDLIFFQLNPISGKRCGLIKVVLKGQLAMLYLGREGGDRFEWLDNEMPLGELEISIYVPCFM